MKFCVLLSLLLTLSACNHASRARAKPGVQSAIASRVFSDSRDDERLRSIREETEARSRSLERQGYTKDEARAVAAAEYFRSGK